MGNAIGFSWMARKSGEVVISHGGQRAAILRGDTAKGFLSDMDGLGNEAQQNEMARLTGNYRRGNERLAKSHPRNV